MRCYISPQDRDGEVERFSVLHKILHPSLPVASPSQVEIASLANGSLTGAEISHAHLFCDSANAQHLCWYSTLGMPEEIAMTAA